MELISVTTILEKAAEELEIATQNCESYQLGFALEHFSKAEALVELLEVAHCGSVGGFGKGQETVYGNPVAQLDSRLDYLNMVIKSGLPVSFGDK